MIYCDVSTSWRVEISSCFECSKPAVSAAPTMCVKLARLFVLLQYKINSFWGYCSNFRASTGSFPGVLPSANTRKRASASRECSKEAKSFLTQSLYNND